MEKIDILHIHHDILKLFANQVEKLPTLKSYIQNLKKFQKNSLSFRISHTIKNEIISLQNIIHDIENNISKNYYMMDALSLISDYKKLLQIPIKVNFMGKQHDTPNINISKLISQYLQISKKYKKQIIKYQKLTITCKSCPNSTNFTIDNNYYICSNCGLQICEIENKFSYNAISRVNITSKYTYDRKIHFRDCVNQFQGKQNTVIPDILLDYLIERIKSHHLVEKNAKLPFSNITKEQLFLFLKDGKYSKYYDDLALIHYKITGIKPPDISHIESQLIADFDILTNLYDIHFRKDKKFRRKNFINTQYVLYQLLRKYNYPCKSSDFNILKTVERKTFHDDICRKLFNELKWNFKAIF